MADHQRRSHKKRREFRDRALSLAYNIYLLIRERRERARVRERTRREILEQERTALRLVRAQRTVETVRAIKLRAEAIRSDEHRLLAAIEKIWTDYYYPQLQDIVATTAMLSKAGMMFITPDTPNRGLVKAFARYFYCPTNPDVIHGSIYAVRLTPLTFNYLEGENADFYIMSEVTQEQLNSQVVERPNPIYHLLEYLRYIMANKQRKERFRKKRKGHWGVIAKDEELTPVYTSWLEEKHKVKLYHFLLCSYCRKWYEAQSIGKPELFGRIKHVNVVAIVGRKGSVTRRWGSRVDKWALTDRLRSFKRW